MSSDDFGVLLGRGYVTFVRGLHHAMGEAGYDDVRSSFGYVFRALDDEALSLRELADRLGMTPPGALKIVDDMVGAGYVARESDQRDGRVKRLRLTARGQGALAAARGHHAHFEEELARRCGARRAATVRAVLEEWLAGEPDAGAAVLRDV